MYYAYDNANELLSEIQQPAWGFPRMVAYSYDADSNRASLIYPDGTFIGYSYNNRNEMIGITQDTKPLATCIYDWAGNRIGKNLANNTSVAYTYDKANRLIGITHTNYGGAFEKLTYGLNAVGDRTSRTENGVIDNYSYDPIDQVTGVKYGSGASSAYAYDAAGNRASAEVGGLTTDYTTNSLNQYSTVGTAKAIYDGRGNLIGMEGQRGVSEPHYTFDGLNRLTNAEVDGNILTETYDAKNRVVSRTINGETTHFIWDGWNLISEYNATGNYHKRYINGANVDEVLLKINGSEDYYHQDGLGSTVALTDGKGNVIEKYTYDIYGTASISDGTGHPLKATAYGNRFLFTGREFISQVNLYDYRNRVYSADLGRWLQRDPLKNAERKQGPNLYEYVNDNPMNGVDPLGLFDEVECQSKCLEFCGQMPCPNDCAQSCFKNCAEGKLPSPLNGLQTPPVPTLPGSWWGVGWGVLKGIYHWFF